MTRVIRSRRAGISRDLAKQRPLYARMLGLQYLTPSGFLCFVFLEGAVALGILLALAELVSWWGVLVLPLAVAFMVKVNDVIAGSVSRPPAAASTPARTPIRQRAAGTPSKSADAPQTDAAATSGVWGLPASASPVVRRAAIRPATMEPRTAPTAAATGGVDAAALNGPPVARHWTARTEELEAIQQRARQTATRRYE
jgi:hypothetical protein